MSISFYDDFLLCLLLFTQMSVHCVPHIGKYACYFCVQKIHISSKVKITSDRIFFFLLEVKLFKPCLFVVIFTTLTQVINERICFYLSTFSGPVLSSFYLSKGSQSVL